MPRSVEPSLPMSVRKISPIAAVLVHAGGDVALVAADRELVRDRLALARHALAARAGLGEGLADGLLHERVDFLAAHCRASRRRLTLLRVGAQRLRGLGAVAVDRERLDPEVPGLRVGVGDVLDGGALREVDGLGDRAGDEGLHGAHHLDVAHVRDRALADGDVEHRQVLVGEAGRADDRAVLGEVRLDLLDLRLGVAEGLQRERDGAVDDRHLPAADELLELDEREVGLDAGRVAVHQEGDRAGGGEHGGLRVAVAEALAELRRPRPRSAARRRAARRRGCRSRRSRRRRRGACASRRCAPSRFSA